MIEFKAKIDYDFTIDSRILRTRIKNYMTGELFLIKGAIIKANKISYQDSFIEENSFASDSAPLISNEQFIQGVLNAAWEVGFRPIGFNDTQQETKALRAHLEDMQKIVMNSKAINWK